MNRQRAQSLVEFAFVFPIFLMLVLALLDFGRAAWYYNTLSDVARIGARQFEVGTTPTADLCKPMLSSSCTSVIVAPCNPGPPSVTVTYTFQPVIALLGSLPITLSATQVVPNVPGVCTP